MNLNLHFVLIVAFLICEILAAFGATVRTVNLMALGLAFFGASLLV